MRILILCLAAAFLAGCSRPYLPAAPPLPASPRPEAPPAPSAEREEAISICVFEQDSLALVPATYRPERGDTVVGGRPFREVFPSTTPPYAEGADWFVRMEPVPVGTGRYRWKVKYGLPRVLLPSELQRAGNYRGIPMFSEAGSTGVPEVVYFLVRPGCEFQPYQAEYNVGEVRG